MAIDFRPVYSSYITEIGHNSETNEMVVKYKKGKPSLYSDVPFEKYQVIAQSPSVGQAVHDIIRGQHPHQYVER